MEKSRIASALRSARQRAGWSRETLAYHSGVSWSAIAQIESGRRQDVRLRSLTALAEALQVSVDYLVGGKATVTPAHLNHHAFIYDSEEQFVEVAGHFLAEGVDRSESVLAVTTRSQIGLLREALGDSADEVEFADSTDWYRTPENATRGYLRFVTDKFDGGANWIRVLGEPVWAGRSRAEAEAWTRYESLINLFFAPAPATILCPYDATALSKRIVADALHTHPEIARDVGPLQTSTDYERPESFLLTS